MDHEFQAFVELAMVNTSTINCASSYEPKEEEILNIFSRILKDTMFLGPPNSGKTILFLALAL
ncbi:unnamed protein product [Arabis nemorensis]|uniref:Uncharacterized protein n=1 Tax=Arabis nemorensis TaxID=586526 RepID=A0A565B2E2_9BRAS|nr:unnamed protein product [Arabis nemorensis]